MPHCDVSVNRGDFNTILYSDPVKESLTLLRRFQMRYHVRKIKLVLFQCWVTGPSCMKQCYPSGPPLNLTNDGVIIYRCQIGLKLAMVSILYVCQFYKGPS